MTMLQCRGLLRSYGSRRAVDGLSFDVHAGEAYGLLGPNGAGKTTTIKMVCGILDPDEGAITIDGIGLDHRTRAVALASLGYVPDDIALFPPLSLAENVSFWCRVYGLKRREREQRTTEVLDLVGLADRAGEHLERCSGGMKRRVNLAVGLIHHPRVLVLDEPTVGVDAQSRASLLSTIGALRDQGTAVLYTSHYFDEIGRLCDRIGIIDHGRMLIEGAPERLVDRNTGIEDLEALFLQMTGTELRD
jgi:ABC-2 type transport system ATP-binding protein